MLHRLNELEGYAIRAIDGVIGQVTDFLFDDESWVVRYLAVYTGSWISNRTVLISPIAVGRPNWSNKTLRVPMTTAQIRDSPDVDTQRPVSRQYELGYCDYYGYYPYYWKTATLWGESDYPERSRSGVEPQTVAADRECVAREVYQHRKDDPHLRSANAVMHYHLEASDGGIGHVQGLLLDEETWAIRYFVVDTSNWWAGHKVLIAPQWIKGMSWSERKVSINLTREAVMRSPPYESELPLHRQAEIDLHNHYRRPGYWANQVRLENPEFRPIMPGPEGPSRPESPGIF